jgi:hypothetical protein
MLVTVNVNQEDINGGDATSNRACPIYLALKRIVKPETRLVVWNNSLNIGDNEFSWEFDSQIPYQLNINHEEHRGLTTDDLEPFSFTLDVPITLLKDNVTAVSNSSDYRVDFTKSVNGKDYTLRDSDGDNIILTLDQIVKLYNAVTGNERIWNTL